MAARRMGTGKRQFDGGREGGRGAGAERETPSSIHDPSIVPVLPALSLGGEEEREREEEIWMFYGLERASKRASRSGDRDGASDRPTQPPPSILHYDDRIV